MRGIPKVRIEDVHPKILEVCILYGELDSTHAIDAVVLNLISNVRFRANGDIAF